MLLAGTEVLVHKQHNFGHVQIEGKALADGKINVIENFKVVFESVENI